MSGGEVHMPRVEAGEAERIEIDPHGLYHLDPNAPKPWRKTDDLLGCPLEVIASYFVPGEGPQVIDPIHRTFAEPKMPPMQLQLRQFLEAAVNKLRAENKPAPAPQDTAEAMAEVERLRIIYGVPKEFSPASTIRWAIDYQAECDRRSAEANAFARAEQEKRIAAEAALASLRAEREVPVFAIPAKLRPALETLWRYGEIYEVKGVQYPAGSHRQCLDKLRDFLWPDAFISAQKDPRHG